MRENFYPEFIRKLPQADLPIDKVVGYLFQGTHGQICFFDFEAGTDVPAHSHGNQWGVVLDGKFSLTMNGDTRTLRKGDSYYIPAGMVHSAKFEQACKILDFFEDANRYKLKEK
ncbi:MAG: cupin domain-containing protein [bacterium]